MLKSDAGISMDVVEGVFLSYSHVDASAALRLKAALKKGRIPVRIDAEGARLGGSITEFIFDSVRSTKVTVWVVSKASFASGWVALELATTLADKQLWQQRQLIACHVDEEFRQDDFVFRVVDAIDARLAKIDHQSQEQEKRGLDTTNLNAERTRLRKLRGNIADLLAYLQERLCLDVSEPRFADSAERLVSELSSLASAVEAPAVEAPTPLAKANDFIGRRKEIRELFFNNSPERAFARLMDFVHDFSDPHVDEVVILSATFRGLGSAQSLLPLEVVKERAQLMKRALQLIEEVIEALSQEAA